MRRRVRNLLETAGLLEVAREGRDIVSSVPWIQDNLCVWRNGAADGLPIPPLRLVRSSTGTSSLAWLFEGGARASEALTAIVAKNGGDIRALDSILDFGCGCGRVIRRWAGLNAAVHGCDYNRASIEWCRRNLPFATFSVNQLQPPLPYPDSQFALVYALSVFTHMPEAMIVAWLREMARILRPGGLLIISTHGEAYVGDLTPEQQHRFRSGQLVVKGENEPGTNRCGVYMSEEYVRRHLTNGFELIDFLPEGARGNPRQDLVLLRSRSRVVG